MDYIPKYNIIFLIEDKGCWGQKTQQLYNIISESY